jgi:hypothetical protein
VTVAGASPPGEQFTRPLDLPLVTTTIKAAQDRLGVAEITVDGHHEESVCYFDAPSRTFVGFMAQAEGLSGSFTARILRGSVPRSCSHLPAWAMAKLEKGVGGLRLGMPRDEFAKVVGKALQQIDGFDVATFGRQDQLSRRSGDADPEILFVAITVRGRFENGLLVEYWVLKSAST